MKNYRLYIYMLFVVGSGLILSSASAQTGDVNRYGQFKSNRSVQTYDSLLMQLNQRNSQEAYERFYNEFIDIKTDNVNTKDVTGNNIYEKRLKLMATEIQLPYNHVVNSYINIYTRKGMIENILGRAQYYFPLFEEALYRHNLPMELKMLPVVESALIAKARSHASAVGLWQFMAATGKSYGLEINSFVDERCDPVKSTEAACLFLKDLYNIYNDWTLAIAAYNCGPGRVNKALARAKDATNYWEIYEYLPSETRGYLPAFIAASYAYTYHKAHGMSPAPISHPMAVDTVMIDRMLHLEQVSSTLNVPIEVLRDLNPQYRIDIIPAIAKKYPLVLPQKEVSKFIQQQPDIYAKDTVFLAKYLDVKNLDDAQKVANNSGAVAKGSGNGTKINYKIKSGDTLGSIARRHGVKVSDLQKWNGLKNSNIRAGKNLVIYKK